MADLTNSHSLTDFQRNAWTYIESINETHEPILLTVNGTVQAVLVDPISYQQAEEQLERTRFAAAVREGEQAIREGRTRSAEEVFDDLKGKHGF